MGIFDLLFGGKDPDETEDLTDLGMEVYKSDTQYNRLLDEVTFSDEKEENQDGYTYSDDWEAWDDGW